MKTYSIVEFGAPLAEREVPVPAAEGRSVVVKMKAAGICHSDLHIWEGGYDLGHGKRISIVDRGTPLPFTMGHENAGEVVAVGPDAQGEVEIGANYVVFPWIGCRQCETCASGFENLCLQPRHIGIHEQGGYAEYLWVPDPKYLIPIGDLDPAQMAPYACSGVTTYSAIRKLGDVVRDKPIAIVGAGALGLMALHILKAVGGKGAVSLDIDPAKRELALEAGALAAFDPNDPDIVAKVHEACGGTCMGVIDLVGSPQTTRLGVDMLTKGGKLVMVGMYGNLADFPLAMIVLKGLTIVGNLLGTLSEFHELIALVREGKVAPIPLQRQPLGCAHATLLELREGKVRGRAVLCS